MQDYTDIELKIREAKALRDEAIGRMFEAAGVALRLRWASLRSALGQWLRRQPEHFHGLPEDLNPYRSISRKSLSTIFP
ncbi:hypothetical protein MYXO_02867 [Myxococcaceae bacterium]|nr:hypothetical protein MYXO_02867 [Myxococcaceae bacterium]